MSETNKVVLTTNKGVDIDALITEVLSSGATIFDIYPGSNRNVAFTMTRELMEFWENDSRVMGCRWGTKDENGIIAVPTSSTNQMVFARTSLHYVSTEYEESNWGLYECINTVGGIYDGSNGSTRQSIDYSLDGTNVDVIIQDTGIEYNHPEFQDSLGNNRIKKINWDAGEFITGYSQASKSVVTYTFTHDTVLPSVGSYVTVTGVYSWNIGGSNPPPNPGVLPTEYNVDRVLVTAVTNTSITVDYVTPRVNNITSIDGAIIGWIQPGEVTNRPNFYTDTSGHGTNVASIAAGKTYGWAKNANIYVMHINFGTDTNGVDTAASFVAMRIFHQNKPINPVTGFKNPTIVNMSWGTGISATAVTTYANGGSWRNNSWINLPTRPPSIGLIAPRADKDLPLREDGHAPRSLPDIDSEVEDCIAAGIIFVGSAGNDGYYIDVPGGVDYNNRVYLNGGTSPAYNGYYYYQRGSSPVSTLGVICVGAIDYTYRATEVKSSTTNSWPTYSSTNATAKSWFSACGPRIDVWAPGGMIIGAWASNSTSSPTSGPWQYGNTSYKKAKESGTSQASPQVAGLLACVLQANPGFNQNDARKWISENSATDKTANIANVSNNMTTFTGASTSYNDPYNLQGSTTKYLYMPYHTSQSGNATGQGSLNGGGISL